MICRRVCKCEPLLRFNPLNLAKIVCFAKWVKGANCVSSDFLNEKVLMFLTCIILKIKAQLNQLVIHCFCIFLFCFLVQFWKKAINTHLNPFYQKNKQTNKSRCWANTSNLNIWIVLFFKNLSSLLSSLLPITPRQSKINGLIYNFNFKIQLVLLFWNKAKQMYHLFMNLEVTYVFWFLKN